MSLNKDQIANIEHKLAAVVGAGLVATSKGPTDPLAIIGGFLVSWSVVKSHNMNSDVSTTSTSTSTIKS